jgi:hypothetical protein
MDHAYSAGFPIQQSDYLASELPYDFIQIVTMVGGDWAA